MAGSGKANFVSLLVWIFSGALIELISIFAFQDSGAPFLLSQNFNEYIEIMTQHPLTFVGRALMSNALALDVFVGFILKGAPTGVNPALFVTIMVIKAIVPPLLVAWVYAKLTEFDAELVMNAGAPVRNSISYALLIMVGLLLAISMNLGYSDGWEFTPEGLSQMMSIIFGQSVYFVNESLAFYGIVRPQINLMPSDNPILNEFGLYMGNIFTIFGMGFVLTTVVRFFTMLFIMRNSGDQFSHY
jgi:hypothetical protein